MAKVMDKEAEEQERRTWIDLKDVAPMFGMSFNAIKNLISQDKFWVPTYRLGRRRVVDKEVLAAFFNDQKIEGLRRLQSRPITTKPR